MVLEASGHSMHRLRWVKVSRGLRTSAALPTKHPPTLSGGGEGDFRENVPENEKCTCKSVGFVRFEYPRGRLSGLRLSLR